METPTKIKIIETNCSRLVMLMLWLEQFQEFKVKGLPRTHRNTILRTSSNNEVIIYSTDLANQEDLAWIRAMKPYGDSPSIIFISSYSNASVDAQIAQECDFHSNRSLSFKDLASQIKKIINRRKVMSSVSRLPITKAG